MFLIFLFWLRLNCSTALTAIQFCAELGTILTRCFEQRPHSADSELKLDLEIALSGVPANVQPHELLQLGAEDALKRRMT